MFEAGKHGEWGENEKERKKWVIKKCDFQLTNVVYNPWSVYDQVKGKKSATEEKNLFWILFGFYVVLNLKKQNWHYWLS